MTHEGRHLDLRMTHDTVSCSAPFEPPCRPSLPPFHALHAAHARHQFTCLPSVVLTSLLFFLTHRPLPLLPSLSPASLLLSLLPDKTAPGPRGATTTVRPHFPPRAPPETRSQQHGSTVSSEPPSQLTPALNGCARRRNLFARPRHPRQPTIRVAKVAADRRRELTSALTPASLRISVAPSMSIMPF